MNDAQKMKYNPEKHHRRSIRLRGYDYTQPGGYFVTIVTQNHESLFGNVVDGKMDLNEYGELTQTCWFGIPDHFPNAILDESIVMPNHVHGIIVIVDRKIIGSQPAVTQRQRQTEQFGKPVCGSLQTMIRSFKSAVTKQINEHRGTPGAWVWQRNYWERIIRNDNELNRIRKYITNNPLKWGLDDDNPNWK